MQLDQFDRLVRKYLAGEASAEERELLEELLRRLERQNNGSSAAGDRWEDIAPALYARIRQELHPEKIRRRRFAVWTRYAAAAAIAGAVLILFLRKGQQLPAESLTEIESTAPLQEIAPGTEGAILTLGDGTTILLDSAGSGSLARLPNIEVVKSGQKLAFQQVSHDQPYKVVYNTMSTPRGHHYPNLVLADGTRVWLDAGSSIRFPSIFTGPRREVEITGQVWFDVEHDPGRPFVVKARGQEILDLGTQFNVNAYEDEGDLAVTLLEGAVQVGGVTLRPGEQARVAPSGNLQINRNVNIDEVIAWKNGFFSFRNADIPSVMRQLSRWYDVDVEFADHLPDVTFSGEIGRGLKLKEVLDGLAFTQIRFTMKEGRKLIVLP